MLCLHRRGGPEEKATVATSIKALFIIFLDLNWLRERLRVGLANLCVFRSEFFIGIFDEILVISFEKVQIFEGT